MDGIFALISRQIEIFFFFSNTIKTIFNKISIEINFIKKFYNFQMFFVQFILAEEHIFSVFTRSKNHIDSFLLYLSRICNNLNGYIFLFDIKRSC